MSTLSSVPEEHVCEWRAYGRQDGTVVCHGCNHAADVNALINQQIKAVLDEALANSVFKHKHEAEEHVVDYKNGYNDGVEAAEDVIKEIRSRYE